ncbi:NAD-dependent epimerase/dehydratase family protein [Polaribacter glomeratus]|uniref:NAD-dependent epimerase n=1 Tax=Polaribacter glomeratus TaxID=102 RepID=A0A2S7WIR6_9FLAO|nr:NAD-dependent epimerase/dehydratase family protein [Polaribacter glomeratus]PQJ77484.1 NAD-dependent epimerase [Polaribacter glomeratus]TXD66076.1 NAD-dependent epimerase/dehydratase family protein [Polaribacter glomeratus]
MKKDTILIVGSNGQLGTVLSHELRQIYGDGSVITSDLFKKNVSADNFITLDATDYKAVEEIVVKNKITQIYHLAAILSAKGEQNPLGTWDLNMKTLFNVLEVSRLHKVEKVFFPSSIAVFGNNIDKENTLQSSNLTPATVYGMSKAAGENWIHYYYQKYGLDVRSLRYPGVIGYQSLPGGGTTDYAVDIYHQAIKNAEFECFLAAKTTLPMIYMDDAIRATLELMEAPRENIIIRTSYNLAGMSFNPEEIAASIKEHYPGFKIKYKPDFRQGIADSWPKIINDTDARKDWNWKPDYNLKLMTKTMIDNLK